MAFKRKVWIEIKIHGWNEDGNIHISPAGVVDGAAKENEKDQLVKDFYGHQGVVQ